MAQTAIWYGDSGTTKTSQLYYLAKYLWTKKKKKTRLISADGGGYAPFVQSGMIDQGVCQVFPVIDRQKIFADLARIGDGYWPRGDTFDSSNKCKTTPQEWSEIGLIAVESITSIARLLLNYFASYRDASGELIYRTPFTVSDDEYELAGTDKGHYAVVQSALHELIVRKFSRLPVDYVVFTALVGEGRTKAQGETFYGPRAVGVAITEELPTWVGDCLHFAHTEYMVSNERVTGPVAYFRPHEDTNTTVTYTAKARILPELYPELLRKFPGGFVPLGFKSGIALYYHTIEKLIGGYNARSTETEGD